MQAILILIHILLALTLIGLVLLQQGKGASMGAAFGSGSSNTLFGSRGPASFLMKLTGFLIALFFVTSLTLGYLASQQAKQGQNLMAPPPLPAGMMPQGPAPAQQAPAAQSAPVQTAPSVNQAPTVVNMSS